MDFDSWKLEVDKLFVQTFELTSDDVEDYLWYDSFRAGATPKEAFEGWCVDYGFG